MLLEPVGKDRDDKAADAAIVINCRFFEASFHVAGQQGVILMTAPMALLSIGYAN